MDLGSSLCGQPCNHRGVTGHDLKTIQSQEQPVDLTSVLGMVKSRYILADREYIRAAAAAGLVPAVDDPFFYKLVVRNRLIDAGGLADEMRAGP